MTKIRASYFKDRGDFERRNQAGSFMIEPRKASGRFEFVYFCPCGCGLKGRLLIGEHHKPSGPRPSWRWNGSTDAPMLDPSVNHVDHWHGWLRDGYWEVC